jgi:general stress protein 26
MKTTTADRDQEATAKLRKLIEEIAVAMVVTVAPEGTLRSRPMLTRPAEDEGELWFYTSDESGAIHDLADEHAVNVSYADPQRDRYVSVTGQASVVTDREKIEELWDPVLTRYFPEGLEEPHLVLLRVRVEFAEYWDGSSSKMVPVQQAAKQGVDGAGSQQSGTADESAREKRTGRAEGSVEHTKVEIRATPASG